MPSSQFPPVPCVPGVAVSWRVGLDILNFQEPFTSILKNLNDMVVASQGNRSTPGCWAYGDMLVPGMAQLTFVESRSQFGAWCALSSPLVLSNPLTDYGAPQASFGSMPLETLLPFIANPEAIAVDQTYYGVSGDQFFAQATTASGYTLTRDTPFTAPVTFLYKPQAWDNSSVAVFVLNAGNQVTSVALAFSDVPGLQPAASYLVRDVWQRADAGVFLSSVPAQTLTSHDSMFFVITVASPGATTPPPSNPTLPPLALPSPPQDLPPPPQDSPPPPRDSPPPPRDSPPPPHTPPLPSSSPALPLPPRIATPNQDTWVFVAFLASATCLPLVACRHGKRHHHRGHIRKT